MLALALALWPPQQACGLSGAGAGSALPPEHVLNSSSLSLGGHMTSCPHIHARSHGPLPLACSLCVLGDPLQKALVFHFQKQ